MSSSYRNTMFQWFVKDCEASGHGGGRCGCCSRRPRRDLSEDQGLLKDLCCHALEFYNTKMDKKHKFKEVVQGNHKHGVYYYLTFFAVEEGAEQDPVLFITVLEKSHSRDVDHNVWLCAPKAHCINRQINTDFDEGYFAVPLPGSG